MSMLVLEPIFPYLSLLAGLVLGCAAGSWFALIFASLRHRSFPVDQASELTIRIVLYLVPLVVGFLFFRYFFGSPEFNLGETIKHIWIQLLVTRAAWFFGGALFGLIGGVVLIVGV